MKIFAFSDEAASELSGQIAAMKRNGLDGTEIRGVNGRSIVKHTVEEAKEILRQLKDNGLSVWSVGSPIGKIPLDGGGFPEHLDLLRHTLELAAALECWNLRMFSFYLPEGADPAGCRNEVIDRLGQMAEIAEGSGVALCHDDPANFIQCGQDIPEAWKLLGQRVYYMHIKDALADGTVVPAGKGIGHLPEILKDYTGRGGEVMTVEPHLRVFDGLQALEQGSNSAKRTMPEGVYPTADAAFDAACGALKNLI